MKTTYTLSIVIPTYRRNPSLARLLAALARQSLPAWAYEVIVAIDGIGDGSLGVATAFPAPYTLSALQLPHGGRAAACNAGIGRATGELLVLLDDDMEPLPTFLAAHLQAHEDGARRGVLGAVPVKLDRSSTPAAAYIGAKFNQHLEKLAQPGYQLRLRDFYTGNFSIRRDILQEVGAFDEAFMIYGNEDLELSLRLAKAGVQFVYSPAAFAWQHYMKDFPGLAHDNIAKGQTAVLLARKHPEAYTHLRLSTYHQYSRQWRYARAALLGLSQLWPCTPIQLIRFTAWLSRLRPKQLPLYYDFILDYCFWLGVRIALRQRYRPPQTEQAASPVGVHGP